MFKRKFANIEDISVLGFGCMRLPRIQEDKSEIDFPKAQEMIDYAYRNGVNYFDTAYIYHDGLSETFIGEALKKYPRESFHLADKLPMWLIKNEEDVDRIFQEQLDKCQVEYFDFYLAHALNKDSIKDINQYNIYNKLLQKKKEGKIIHLGFSFHDTPEVLEELLNTYEWDFVQIQLNYIDWEYQDSKQQYELIKQKNIPCIIMEPVRGGALATLCKEAVEIFKAADPKASPASWAIRYAASLPNVMSVLSGMSTMEQVEDNIVTLKELKPLSEPDYEVIENALKKYKEIATIPCTACRYCMDCPSGVDIPAIFRMYNNYRLGGIKEFFIEEYNNLGDEHTANNCIECGICSEQCPQHLQIPDIMKEIVTFTGN